MKKKNWLRRILPFLLAVILLGSMIPASAVSQDKALSVSAIASEVVSLREESVKHFLCEDGTYIAATYAMPVHYKENGEWKDINNSLELSSRTLSASGKTSYVPKAGVLSVSLPQDFTGGQQVTVGNKGYTFGFGVKAERQTVSLQSAATLVDAKELPSAFNSQKKVSQEKQGAQTTAERVKEQNAKIMAVDNLSSAVVYKGVFPGTALEYIVTPDRLKENFVVSAPQAEYTYRFDVSMDGLISMPQEDGSILLVAASNPKEVIFTLEAPYMYDAAGETSVAVEMALVEGVLTVTADAAWLNAKDRAFPVVIDPTVIISINDQSIIKDTYVSSLSKNSNYINKAKIYAGKTVLGERTRTYVKFNLPTLPSGAQVSYAQFELMKVGTSANSVLNVRNLASKAIWVPSDIKWSNQPVDAADNSANSLPLVDSRNTTAGSYVYRFDITSALQGWYTGSATGSTNNNGLVITTPNESSTGQVDIYSSRTSDIVQRPVLWFGYEGGLPNYTFQRDTYSFSNYTKNSCPVAGCTSGGHCFGMSATSSMYHLRLLNITNIGGHHFPGLYTLNATATVKEPIHNYQIKQSGSMLASSTVAGSIYSMDITSNWTSVVNYVNNHTHDNKGTLQLVYWNAGDGHAVNFLRYEVVGEQERVYVYDNNFPTVETYFYKDAQGIVRQAPNQSMLPAYNSMALLNISTYFSLAGSFNAAKVIYADKGTISVEGVSAWPMIGDEEHVLFEIPTQLSKVTIVPLVDNATFEYLDNTYSFGRNSVDTIGKFTLAAAGANPNLNISRS